MTTITHFAQVAGHQTMVKTRIPIAKRKRQKQNFIFTSFLSFIHCMRYNIKIQDDKFN